MNYIDRAFEQETPSAEVRGRHGRHRGEWSADRIETLCKLWAILPQISASVIGERMGVSRNSILGKAHRLKLSKHDKNSPTTPRGERRRAFWESANPKAREWTPPADSVALMELPPDLSDCAVPFMAIGHNQCRYPVSAVGKPFMFCAAASWGDGESYCYRHNVLCHKPSAPKRNWREGRRAA